MNIESLTEFSLTRFDRYDDWPAVTFSIAAFYLHIRTVTSAVMCSYFDLDGLYPRNKRIIVSQILTENLPSAIGVSIGVKWGVAMLPPPPPHLKNIKIPYSEVFST